MRNLLHRDVEARLFALKRQAGAHPPQDPTARCALRCRMRPCPSQACPVTRAPPAATCRGPGHPITHCGLQCARRHARRHQLHQHCGRGHRDGHWRRIDRCAIWAPKPPSPAARPLTRAACARRRTVCALSFESAHHPGLYPHVFFELRTDMCGSRPAGCVARSAGATRVRPALACRGA